MPIMGADIPHLPLPNSYIEHSAQNYEEIRVHHVPEHSKEITPTVIVELHRPKKYNAFTNKMMRELESIFTLLDLDDRVKAIVVTGSGRMFCAGADLDSSFKGGEEDNRDHRDGGGRVTMAIMRCRKPTIAAMNGSAVGIGVTMTLPMNIRIVYEGAKIGLVFARRGLVMEAASSFFLPRLIGMSRALHLVTTGATYPANHPLLNNLFSETLKNPEDVLPRALEIADEIAKNCSAVSIFLNKELMYRDTGSPEGQHLLDSKIIYELFSSKDNKDGVKAFLEKRPVKFTGTMAADAPAAWPWYQALDTSNRPKAAGCHGKAKL